MILKYYYVIFSGHTHKFTYRGIFKCALLNFEIAMYVSVRFCVYRIVII